MKQNVYDDPVFFAGYQKMRRDAGGPNRLIEVPTMRELIGDVRGKAVLDLGCGFGRHAFEAARRGASVVALDAGPDEVAQVRGTFAAAARACVTASKVPRSCAA